VSTQCNNDVKTLQCCVVKQPCIHWNTTCHLTRNTTVRTSSVAIQEENESRTMWPTHKTSSLLLNGLICLFTRLFLHHYMNSFAAPCKLHSLGAQNTSLNIRQDWATHHDTSMSLI